MTFPVHFHDKIMNIHDLVHHTVGTIQCLLLIKSKLLSPGMCYALLFGDHDIGILPNLVNIKLSCSYMNMYYE